MKNILNVMLNSFQHLPTTIMGSRTKFGMTKALFFFIFFLFSFLIFNSAASAQVVYPISELGNCRDAQECYLYCEIPKNTPACWSYGKYVLHKQVLAETDEDIAKKYGISFPIAELGNCTNVNQCKAYCDNPSNYEACANFASTHGLQGGTSQSDLVEKAKGELGCTSIESCKTYCEKNVQACTEFAKRHGAYREEESLDAREQALLEKAKGALGCSSLSSCYKVCEQNPQACMEFMKKQGMYYETTHEGFYSSSGEKLPCNSEGECQKYCENNPTACGASPPPCNSDESCRKYCEEHPDECKGYSSSEQNYLGPGGCKTEEECKNYCSAHPSECPGYQQSYPTPSAGEYQPTYYPQPTYSYEQYSQPTYYPQPTYSYEQPQSYPTNSQEQYQQYSQPTTTPAP